MKKKLKYLFAVGVCVLLALTVLACSSDKPQLTQQETIYQMYVTYAQEKGDTVQSYEQWLESIKGAAGAKGDNGLAGLDGADGATWHHGTTTPSNTLGRNGDFYFNSADGSVYLKADGAWGNPIITVKGPEGKPGATWLTGNIAPTNIIGVDGDLYLDTTTSFVYKKKAGSWSKIAELQGLQGIAGEQGVNGTTWLTGEGEPDVATGNDGDLYLCKNTSNVYKKINGEWELFASFNGVSGVDGDAGTKWLFGDTVPTDVEGAQLGDIYLDTTTCFVYSNTSDGWIKIAELKGEQGETGLGIQAIKQVPNDRWGIVTKTVIEMTNGSTAYEFINEPNPKYYLIYDANDEKELRYLLANHAFKIVLTADITLEDSIKITNDCELDLGGHSVSYQSDTTDSKNKATIYGSGSKVKVSISNGSISRYGSDGGRSVQFMDKAIGLLEDVTLNCEEGYGVCVFNGASMTMVNTRVTSKWHAVSTNNLMGGASIIVEKSSLKSTADVAMFLSSFTSTSINNSVLDGNYALHIMMGDVSVTNSKLISRSSYNPYKPTEIGNSGTKETEGAAIVIRTNLYYDKEMKTNFLSLNLANNKIMTLSGVAVSLYDCGDRNLTLSKVEDQSTIVDQFSYAYQYLKAFEKMDPSFVVRDYVYSKGLFGNVVEVGTAEELQKALTAGKSVSLTANIETDNLLGFEFRVGGNINVIGNGFTVKNVNTKTDARVFNIDAEINTDILPKSTFKFYDVKMRVSAIYSRGINWRSIINSKFYITKCDILASYYALNFRATNTENTLVIRDSNIMGWAAVNSYATNSNYYFIDSIMSGLNNKAPGPSNDFTVICLDGGVYPGHEASLNSSFGMKIVAKRTQFIAIIDKPANPQTHVSFQYGAHDNSFNYDENCMFISLVRNESGEIISNHEGIVVDKVFGGEDENFVNGILIEKIG